MFRHLLLVFTPSVFIKTINDRFKAVPSRPVLIHGTEGINVSSILFQLQFLFLEKSDDLCYKL